MYDFVTVGFLFRLVGKGRSSSFVETVHNVDGNCDTNFHFIIVEEAYLCLKAASRESTATHSFGDLNHSCVLTESFSLMVE